ncbi:MAG: peptide deformylase [Oligoflexia bacterium]|nr:peptide deformylase [Oligoflexia bacterium]
MNANQSNLNSNLQSELQTQFLQDYKLNGTKLSVLIYPHPTLSKKAIDVDTTKITPELITLAKNMLYTMYLAPGIGLAAPQVGKSLRLVTLDVSYTRDKIILESESDKLEGVTVDGVEEDEDEEGENYSDSSSDSEKDKESAANIIHKGTSAKTSKYKLDNFHPMVLINPVITNRSGIVKCNEGCLSLPGIHEDIERANEIDVEFTNLRGERENIHATDLLSICIQHECDHLEGIVLLDHLSLLKRNFHKRKLMKRKK